MKIKENINVPLSLALMEIFQSHPDEASFLDAVEAAFKKAENKDHTPPLSPMAQKILAIIQSFSVEETIPSVLFPSAQMALKVVESNFPKNLSSLNLLI